MIRNTMLGLSFLALTATSAFAAPVVTHHVARVVAEGDAAPATDKPAKPAKKAHAKKTAKTAKAPTAEKAPEAK